MSGTSHDGADAALVEVYPETGSDPHDLRIRVVSHTHLPYRKDLRMEIAQAFDGNTERICRLNYVLGEVFARAALTLLKQAGLPSSEIDAIASHGQTIYHIPPAPRRGGSTLQIGEAAVIAERTGILTISDFRARDIAAGGQGAPLVPLADYLLFRREGRKRAVLNIGGMANVTIVSEGRDETVAFDTGPGNALIDETVRLFGLGTYPYDRNGSFARSGTLSKKLLATLLSHPFFRKAPPKSTGRETFGTEYVRDLVKKNGTVESKDILCTLTHLTAVSIFRAIRPFTPDEIIVTGGGVKNRFLMMLLEELFRGVSVRSVADYGIPIEAKEAVSFAILGYETLKRRPGNIPRATGAAHNVILGKITLP